MGQHADPTPGPGTAADDASPVDAGASRRWAISALAPRARSVGEARAAVRAVLAGWGVEEFEWVLSQLLTEVTTNVVLHAGTPFDISISFGDGRVRCEVSDASVRPPRVRDYSPDATTGRGLRLLQELSATWGVERRSDGKTVWFEVEATDESDGTLTDFDALLEAYDDAPEAYRASKPDDEGELMPPQGLPVHIPSIDDRPGPVRLVSRLSAA